jgi:hypothetical protein
MACLYAATGDGLVRLDQAGEAWTVELRLSGSGVQCLAVESAEPDTVLWLVESAAEGPVYAGTDPGRFRSEDRGESMSHQAFEAVRAVRAAGRRNACSLSRTRTGSP